MPTARELTWLARQGIPAITDVDTRALVRHIRDQGAMRGGVFPAALSEQQARDLIDAEPNMVGRDLVRDVTPKQRIVVGDGNTGPRIAMIDTGVKASIVHNLTMRGAIVELHPCTATPNDLLHNDPDAIFPGQRPRRPLGALGYIVDTIRQLIGKRPVYGICLGHQLLCRAVGLETYKLPFGHHGANHPVKDLTTGAVEITSQNHGFAVLGPDGAKTIDHDEAVRWETDFGAAELTHINLYDRTVEGLALRDVQERHRPSTTPRPAPVRTTLSISSTGSWRRSTAMYRADDLHKILLIGSGPIVIGQAAEFDYSGTQACRVLMQEGYEVVLVNSNPATIMTDPEVASTTYIEPLLPGPVRQVIERERPDALLPTLGGQTALNLAKALKEDGTLEEYGVELIGADYDAIERAEDRELFRDTMKQAGLRVPRSAIAHTVDDARAAIGQVGLPFIVRPAFTLGGKGGGVVRTEDELERVVGRGLKASPISQVLIEESVLGWGEFELEVMRDRADNVVIVCSIENLDPMGVHTGDSACVAPQQTLHRQSSTRRTQRDQAIAAIRAVGVETGGIQAVQFAVNRATDEIVVIEILNPRISQCSSALASKATGFPIAKIAASLAVGYTLQEILERHHMCDAGADELRAGGIDYCVVKWPRFAVREVPPRRGRPHDPHEVGR